MKALLTSFVSGMVFALGLGISGMTRPVKVIGFLDFFGAWDASLAFVMMGAIAVYFVAYRWSAKMASPCLAPDFSLPKSSDLDAKLVLGAAIFGAGWGLGGFCPGPALTSLASGALAVFIFTAAMVVGMYLHTWTGESGATSLERANSSLGSIRSLKTDEELPLAGGRPPALPLLNSRKFCSGRAIFFRFGPERSGLTLTARPSTSRVGWFRAGLRRN